MLGDVFDPEPDSLEPEPESPEFCPDPLESEPDPLEPEPESPEFCPEEFPSELPDPEGVVSVSPVEPPEPDWSSCEPFSEPCAFSAPALFPFSELEPSSSVDPVRLPVQYEAEDQSGHQNLKSFVLLFRHMVLLVLLSSSCSKPLIPAQILPGCRSPGLRITPVF